MGKDFALCGEQSFREQLQSRVKNHGPFASWTSLPVQKHETPSSHPEIGVYLDKLIRPPGEGLTQQQIFVST
jgi:hypothetical protein